MANGSGGKWIEVVRVWSGERIWTDICEVDADQCGSGGRARALHICLIFRLKMRDIDHPRRLMLV